MSPDAFARLNALRSSTVPVFMTGQEGQELVTLGYITPDASQPGSVPGSCTVTITDAGIAALQQAPPSVPVISQIRTGVALPAAGKRGGANNLKPRKSVYPFDQLPEPVVGPDGSVQCASFHVSPTADNPEPWKSMASNVSAANRRSEVAVTDASGQVVMETIPKKTLVKDAAGNAVLGPDGKKVYTEAQVTQTKMQATKKFIARRVNADDPDGVGARVFRVPLNS